VAIKI